MTPQSTELFLAYGRDWNDRFMFMLDPVDEATARQAYEAKQKIAIAAGDEPLALGWDNRDEENGNRATWLIHANPGAAEGARFEVTFFNFWGTEEGRYVFHEQDNGRLLLTQVDVFHYEDHSRRLELDEWSRYEETKFRADGYSNHTVRTRLPDGSKDIQFTEYTGTDITANWEPIPAWGDWDGLTRDDRFA